MILKYDIHKKNEDNLLASNFMLSISKNKFKNKWITYIL